jgi:LysM repeat protein
VPVKRSRNERGNPFHDTEDGRFAKRPSGSGGGSESSKDAPQKESGGTHTVVKGDTLWDIAERYYGDGSRWPEIYEANKDEIQDPDLIYPGQEFTIPGEGEAPTEESDSEEEESEDDDSDSETEDDEEEAEPTQREKEAQAYMARSNTKAYLNASDSDAAKMRATSQASLKKAGLSSASAAIAAGWEQYPDGSWIKSKAAVLKYNPYHDRYGRFTSASAATTVVRGTFQNKAGVKVSSDGVYDIKTSHMTGAIRARVRGVDSKGKLHADIVSSVTNVNQPVRVDITGKKTLAGDVRAVDFNAVTTARPVSSARVAVEGALADAGRGVASATRGVTEGTAKKLLGMGILVGGVVAASQAQTYVDSQRNLGQPIIPRRGTKKAPTMSTKITPDDFDFLLDNGMMWKYNPYHARDGKFTSAGSAFTTVRGVTVKTGKHYDIRTNNMRPGTYVRAKVTSVEEGKPRAHTGVHVRQAHTFRRGTKVTPGQNSIMYRYGNGYRVIGDNIVEAHPINPARQVGISAAKGGAKVAGVAAGVATTGLAVYGALPPNVQAQVRSTVSSAAKVPGQKVHAYQTRRQVKRMFKKEVGNPFVDATTVEKYNPYHAKDGKFTTKGGAVVITRGRGGLNDRASSIKGRGANKGAEVSVRRGRTYDLKIGGRSLTGHVENIADDGTITVRRRASFKSNQLNRRPDRDDVTMEGGTWSTPRYKVNVHDLQAAEKVSVGRRVGRGALAGGLVGSVVPVLGTSTGVVVGGLSGLRKDQFEQLRKEAGLSRVALAYGAYAMDEAEAEDDAVPFSKSVDTVITKAVDEKRYTLGPVYSPSLLDAHSEFVEPDDLQKSMWGYVRKDDRTLWRQHKKGVERAGEWVEIMTWPHEVETTMMVPGDDGTKLEKSVTFPAGTTFMGVIWDENTWPDVKAGKLRGFSMGGRAKRIEAEFDGEAPVRKAADHDPEVVDLSEALGIPVDELEQLLAQIDEEIRSASE